MATVTRTIDDLDGTEGADTVKFSVDGIEYEVDLHERHADELRAALAKYIAVARRTSTAPVKRKGSQSAPSGETAEIRAWAQSQGMKVSDRGRIPADIIEAFKARQGASAAPRDEAQTGGDEAQGVPAGDELEGAQGDDTVILQWWNSQKDGRAATKVNARMRTAYAERSDVPQ